MDFAAEGRRMTMTVRAVYRNGVLRPDRPLPVPEGAAVDVLVTPTPTPTEDEVLRRMEAAGSLEELFAIADSIPAEPGDDGYGTVRGMNETRRAAGERPLTPGGDPGTRP